MDKENDPEFFYTLSGDDLVQAIKVTNMNYDGFNSVYFQKLMKTEYGDAEFLLEKMLELFPDNKNEIETKLSYVFFRQGKLQETIDLANTVLNRNPDSEETVGKLYNNQGLALWYQGNLRESINKFYQFKEISVRLDQKNRVADANNNLGILYGTTGEYKKSIEYFEEALGIYKELDIVADMGYISNNLSVVYRFLGEYKKALNSAHEALEIRKKLGNNREIAVTLRNLGCIYVNMANYTNGLKFLSESLQIRRTLGNSIDISDTLFEIFKAYYLTKDFDKAEKTLEIMKETDIIRTIEEFAKKSENSSDTAETENKMNLIEQRYHISTILLDKLSFTLYILKNRDEHVFDPEEEYSEILHRVEFLLNYISNFEDKLLLYLLQLEVFVESESYLDRALEILEFLDKEAVKEMNHLLRVHVLLTQSKIYQVEHNYQIAKQQALTAHNIALRYGMHNIKKFTLEHMEVLEDESVTLGEVSRTSYWEDKLADIKEYITRLTQIR